MKPALKTLRNRFQSLYSRKSQRQLMDHKLLNSNKQIKIVHLQKLVNQSVFNGTLVTEMINSSFHESKKSFIKQGTL